MYGSISIWKILIFPTFIIPTNARFFTAMAYGCAAADFMKRKPDEKVKKRKSGAVPLVIFHVQGLPYHQPTHWKISSRKLLPQGLPNAAEGQMICARKRPWKTVKKKDIFNSGAELIIENNRIMMKMKKNFQARHISIWNCFALPQPEVLMTEKVH